MRQRHIYDYLREREGWNWGRCYWKMLSKQYQNNLHILPLIGNEKNGKTFVNGYAQLSYFRLNIVSKDIFR